MRQALFVAIDPISSVTYEALAMSLVRNGLIEKYTIIESSDLDSGFGMIFKEMLQSNSVAKEMDFQLLGVTRHDATS